MNTIRYAVHTLFLIFIIGCGIPQAEYDRIKKENEKLKYEIAECELTPEEMLSKAYSQYKSEEYAYSRKRIKILLAKYANSDEAEKGRILLKKVEAKILETGLTKNQETDEEPNEDPEEEEIESSTEDPINEEKNKKALAKMKKKYDIDNDVTWYSDKYSSKLSTKNYIQAYIGKKEKKPWLGLSINYFSKKKWLHTERIEITVDGKTYEITENTPGEFQEKEESGGKREWLDRVIKNEDIRLTEEIASSKTAKIKFVGQDDIYSRKISKTEKKSLQNVLNAFVALGGNTD